MKKFFLILVLLYCPAFQNIFAQGELLQINNHDSTKNSFANIRSKNLLVEKLDRLPLVGSEELLKFFPGVSFKAENNYYRGESNNSISYSINGFSLTDNYYSGQNFRIPQQIIDKIDFYLGNKTFTENESPAKFNYSLISPEKNIQFLVDYSSDNINFAGKDDFTNSDKRLGAYWFGNNEINSSLIGKIGSNFTYLVNYNYLFIRDRFTQGYSGNETLNLIGDFYNNDETNPLDTLNLYFPTGALKNNFMQSQNYLVNLSYNYNDLNFEVLGIYQNDEEKLNNDPFLNILNDRIGISEKNSGQINFAFTHHVSEKISYKIGLNYFHRLFETYDPYLKNNYINYGSSAANEENGIVWTNNYLEDPNVFNPIEYNIYGYQFNSLNDISTDYSKFMEDNFSLNFLVNANFIKNHELSIAGKFQSSIYRNWSFDNQKSIYRYIEFNSDQGNFVNDELIEGYLINGNLNNFGYDILGKEYEGNNYFAPIRSQIGSLLISDTFLIKKFEIEAGLGINYYDLDNIELKNPNSPETVFASPYTINEDGLKRSDINIVINPKLNIGYLLNENIHLHTSYASFSYLPKLSDLYRGIWSTRYGLLNSNIFSYTKLINTNLVKSDHIQIGAEYIFNQHLSFNLSAYNSESENVKSSNKSGSNAGSPYQTYDFSSGDASSNRGLDLTIQIDNYFGFSLLSNISFQSFEENWFLENFSSKMILNYHYKNHSSIFDNFGFSVLHQFHDGYNFKKSVNGKLSEIDMESFSQIDFKIYKSIDVNNFFTADIYFEAVNLFDAVNYYNIFITTEKPYEDANSGIIESLVENYGENYRTLFIQENEYFNKSNNFFAPPRQLRFGIRVNI